MSETVTAADRALSERAMLDSLHDIRLPAEAAGGLVADLAAVIGCAGAAALVLLAVARLFSQTPPRRAAKASSPLLALRDLPEARRRVALLHLLREHAPDRYASVKATLYRPDGAMDLDALEAEVARRV